MRHQILEAFLLKHSLLFLLLPLFLLFVKLFSFSFGVSHLFVALPPEMSHFFGQFSGAHHRLLRHPLCPNSSFPDLFEAVLAEFLIVIFLVSLKLLVHPVSFRDVFFNDILPCSLNILGLLLVLGLFGGILDFLSLI